jgi:hypothetical protein
LAFARFKSTVKVPPSETGELPTERVELVELTVIEELSNSAFEMVCPRLVKQVPPTARHPAVTFKPFPEKVDVAEEVFRTDPPVIVSPLEVASDPAETPPAKVEVAVEVFLNNPVIKRFVVVACVVVALAATSPSLKVCSPVQVFLFPRLSDATTSPVVGETVKVPSAFETDVTTPEAPASEPH